jgi:WD40 repeat protein
VAALSSDASRYAAVTPDGMQVLLQGGWQGSPPQRPTGHTDVILALAANEPTGRVVTGGRDRTARVWNTRGGPAVVLYGHSGPVTGVAFSPDGSRVATCSEDGTVKIWDPVSGMEILTVRPGEGRPSAVAFSPSGLQLAVAHGSRVTVWCLNEALAPQHR